MKKNVMNSTYLFASDTLAPYKMKQYSRQREQQVKMKPVLLLYMISVPVLLGHLSVKEKSQYLEAPGGEGEGGDGFPPNDSQQHLSRSLQLRN